MKLPKVGYSLAEQAFASGFTFLLFVAAARLLSQSALERYTALFTLNQCLSFFLFGLVLLPMASATGETAGKQLGISIVMLGGLVLSFAVVSPLMMHYFRSLREIFTFELWVLSLTFFASQCLYESARWLTIRLRSVRAALAVTSTRFALFFTGIALVGSEHLDAANFVITQILVNSAAMIGFTFALRGVAEEVRLALPDRSAIGHFSNFGTALANFLTNLTTVAFVDHGLGPAGLAAFQSLRSATNPIGVLSQVIDNHFSAYLARTGSGFEGRDHIVRYALGAAAVLVILAFSFGQQIVRLFFGEVLVGNWVLLPLLLMAALAHALTRPVFVTWRLEGNTRALNRYSLLLIVAALPALVLLGWAGSTLTMITLFALLPATALIVHQLQSAEKA